MTDYRTVQVYLEGRSAISNYTLFANRVEGFVGNSGSRIKIIDFRPSTIEALNRLIEGNGSVISFTSAFNQPANVQILGEDDGDIIIRLSPPHRNSRIEPKKLWLGVIWNGKMSVQDFLWEVLRPVVIDQEPVTAFACIIKWIK